MSRRVVFVGWVYVWMLWSSVFERFQNKSIEIPEIFLMSSCHKRLTFNFNSLSGILDAKIEKPIISNSWPGVVVNVKDNPTMIKSKFTKFNLFHFLSCTSTH